MCSDEKALSADVLISHGNVSRTRLRSTSFWSCSVCFSSAGLLAMAMSGFFWGKRARVGIAGATRCGRAGGRVTKAVTTRSRQRSARRSGQTSRWVDKQRASAPASTGTSQRARCGGAGGGCGGVEQGEHVPF